MPPLNEFNKRLQREGNAAVAKYLQAIFNQLKDITKKQLEMEKRQILIEKALTKKEGK